MVDFKLSVELTGHEDDVRAVTFPSQGYVVSASRDATVRRWHVPSQPPHDPSIISHGAAFINAVAYLQPSTKYPEGLIVSGGKETIIEVREPGKQPEESAEALLLGHTSNICALDTDPSGKFIVSGSWDGSARIWGVGKWECDNVLEAHEGSVWAVLVYDAQTIITGCADKLIRVYHTSGKLIRTIRGSTDVVRALCRTPNHPSGADFASAGNDGTIRLWNIKGQQVGELLGHESFIYSLAYLPKTGEIISSSEDRTARIWKGNECIQTITHPAISIWSVAVCPENGDIVTGASDRIVRVFSRDPGRQGDADAIKHFEDSVKASSIPQQQAGDVNKENLPGPEFLEQKSGTKEGQVVMIKEHNGAVTAHQWSAGSHEWINVGTVVDAVGSSGKKVEYQGKEYDYVFDVDIEDGKPALKLPYNLSQNPYEAATKFIENNEGLPMTYLDQVANFIITNTQGANIGTPQSQGPAPVGHDPWGSESRYRPGESNAAAPTPKPKILPQKTYLTILVAQVDKMQKKIEELNKQLIENGSKHVSLNPSELSVLKGLRKELESTSTMNASAVADGVDLAVKLSTQWPYGNRLPGLDLLRLLAVAPKTAAYTHPRGGNIINIIVTSVNESKPPTENNIMMAIRFFVNLFESAEGRKLAISEFDSIQAFTTGPINAGTTNRNLLVAATTMYINFAVLLTSESSISTAFENALAMLEVLSKILSLQTDSEVVYRAMVATGTLLGIDDEVRSAAKDVYGMEKSVGVALAKAADPRVKSVAAEIRTLLNTRQLD